MKLISRIVPGKPFISDYPKKEAATPKCVLPPWRFFLENAMTAPHQAERCVL